MSQQSFDSEDRPLQHSYNEVLAERKRRVKKIPTDQNKLEVTNEFQWFGREIAISRSA